MIKYYLFDFDGTLVNSMPSFISTMLRILDENGIEYDDGIVNVITPLGYLGTARYYVGLGVPMTEDELVAKMNEYALDDYAHRILAKSNVIEVLKELKRRGASLNVLTASPHSALDPCLQRLGIFELFDNVWSCDDFGTTKADTQIYVRAAEKMGAQVREVLFLDDNPEACRTARAAGMPVCAVFDETSAIYREEMARENDYYAVTLAQLLEL